MTDDYTSAREMAQVLIANKRKGSQEPLKGEDIEDAVGRVLVVQPEWADTVDRERLVKELMGIFNTWIGDIRSLDADDGKHVPWLNSCKSEVKWKYWKRYRQLLRRKGWAEATINKMDEMTEHTLERLEDPLRKEPWDRRGLVVGHVQSGKTSNYIGLICKAVDAGYKVIIVLAGLHNNLRAQTHST